MNFKKRISSFDIESTGTDVITDRICELSVCVIQPDGGSKQQTFRFNPGRSSHPEALKVHGLTDEMLEFEPSFVSVAKELFETCFLGNDLHGYNIKRFDVPLLSEEFARAGIVFPEPGTQIFDSMIIFQKQNPRDLKSAYKHYTQKELENAHAAEHDTAASVEIFDAQLARHFNEDTTPEELAAYCSQPNEVDYAGKLIKNEKGEICFNFGKNKDKPVVLDKSYAEWMLGSGFAIDTKRHLRSILGIPDPLASKRPDELHLASSADDSLF